MAEAAAGRAERRARSHWARSASAVQPRGVRAGEIPLPGREVCRLVSTVCLTRRHAPSEGAQLCVPQGPSETSKGDVPPSPASFQMGAFILA